MNARLDTLTEQYAAGLLDYVAGAGEAALRQAYELGRKAIAEGLGVLGVADVHHRALLKILLHTLPPDESSRVLKAADDFFAESLAPFEMTLRVFREANAALLQLNKTLEVRASELAAKLVQSEKVAAMGSLLAGVAHELNNPLSVVLGQTALLHELTLTGPVAARAEKITQAAERCTRIVRNFLALARQHPPERQRVWLNQVILEAVELLAYPLRVDTVEVQLALADDLPSLWADPHQLHQVVVDLISNAHQAMRETALPRRLTVTTRFHRSAARISLEVADTGPGVPPEIQARIFEPFFTTKPLGVGTGLGLPLCQGVIEGHGGTICLASTVGQGAVFRVELPVEAGPVTAPETHDAEAPPSIQGKVILVVDDEPEIAEMLADMLAVHGHRVETAGNGAIALEKLRQHAYDVILTDLRMPELDGPSLYRQVERDHQALCRRFIFLTGDTLSPAMQAFVEQTGAPIVSKPFTPEEVRRAVQQVLQGKGA
jgi:signal transduction histidine kinase/CheY-like chemotaxis protein